MNVNGALGALPSALPGSGLLSSVSRVPEADGTDTLHLSLPQPTDTRELFLRLIVTQQ